MGKSNRIRSNRETKTMPLGVKKKKNGMPSWLMTLITLVVTVAILGGVALSLLSANGVFNRMSTLVSTENYSVNANMMSYYFQTQYQNFYSSNSSYISYLLDTSKSLKEQAYTYATEGEEMTWFDYFMDQTVTSVKSMLVYCEEAKARGIDSLSEEEQAEIDTTIESLKTTATLYGYSLNSYIAQIYGAGVRENDIRKAVEYSAIAAKCMNVLSEELDGKITEDRITAEYDGNTRDYNVVDYMYYTISVDYEEVAEEVLGEDYEEADLNARADEVLAKYTERINEAKATADKLKAANADADTFKKALLTQAALDAFDTVYAEVEVADADKPADADLEAIKAALTETVVNEVLEGKDEAADAATKGEGDAKGTAYGKEVTNTYVDTLNEVKDDVFEDVKAAVDTYVVEKGNYVNEEDDFSVWAFDTTRATKDVTVITEGDGAEETVAAEDKYTDVTVYFLTKPQYPDAEKARNVAYILFSTEDAAKTAIQDLLAKGELTLEAFEEYAESATSAAGHTHVENYTEGTFGSTVFDEWVYGEDTELNTITAKPLSIDSSTYAVAYYYADGEELWKVEVRSSLLNADYEAYYTAMEGKYAVTVKEKSLDKVDA